MAIAATGGRVVGCRRLGSQQVPARVVQLLRATCCLESCGMDHPAVTGDDGWGSQELNLDPCSPPIRTGLYD
jgi:hypothetical protein